MKTRSWWRQPIYSPFELAGAAIASGLLLGVLVLLGRI